MLASLRACLPVCLPARLPACAHAVPQAPAGLRSLRAHVGWNCTGLPCPSSISALCAEIFLAESSQESRALQWAAVGCSGVQPRGSPFSILRCTEQLGCPAPAPLSCSGSCTCPGLRQSSLLTAMPPSPLFSPAVPASPHVMPLPLHCTTAHSSIELWTPPIVLLAPMLASLRACLPVCLPARLPACSTPGLPLESA